MRLGFRWSGAIVEDVDGKRKACDDEFEAGWYRITAADRSIHGPRAIFLISCTSLGDLLVCLVEEALLMRLGILPN